MPEPEGTTFGNSPPVFEPTFTGSRQEQLWVRGALFGFWEDSLITDVLYRVAGGKEATVYCCRANPTSGLDLVAAKVLRPRRFRAMRNYSLYREGRGLVDGEGKQVFDGRSLRALRKKTTYGRRLDSAAWLMAEYAALRELHEAGADVPRPIAFGGHAFLMEFVGDEDGPAPPLNTVSLEPEPARALFERLVENLEILLSRFRVHADLSAYNVLYFDGRATLIDLPQVVDALRHPRAFEIFRRDVDRLCAYFEKQGVETDAVGLACELWADWVG